MKSNNRKKYIRIGVLLLFFLLLTSCGQKDAGEQKQTDAGESVSLTSSETTEPAAPSAAADDYAVKAAADMFLVLNTNPDQYGITAQEVADAYFSAAFRVHGTDVETHYYALVGTERILGILTVFRSGKGYGMSYAKDFAEELTAAWKSGNPFALSWNKSDPDDMFAKLEVSYTDVAEASDVSRSLRTPLAKQPDQE